MARSIFTCADVSMSRQCVVLGTLLTCLAPARLALLLRVDLDERVLRPIPVQVGYRIVWKGQPAWFCMGFVVPGLLAFCAKFPLGLCRQHTEIFSEM